ncbi:hypothetical protein MHYP_G00024870 [Metynnis hypsauchen]
MDLFLATKPNKEKKAVVAHDRSFNTTQKRFSPIAQKHMKEGPHAQQARGPSASAATHCRQQTHGNLAGLLTDQLASSSQVHERNHFSTIVVDRHRAHRRRAEL